MKIPAKLAIVGTLSFLTVACSHTPNPIAENFPASSQQKVRAAGHWDMLAKDVAQRASSQLGTSGTASGAQLVVAMPSNPTAFDRAFHDLLTTHLVGAGYAVGNDVSPNALRVSYRTQLVRHDSKRESGIPRSWTALASGLYVLNDISGRSLATTASMVTVLGATAVADSLSYTHAGGPTSHELILTTTVENQHRYVARLSNVYYVESLDTGLFIPSNSLAPKLLKVVSE